MAISGFIHFILRHLTKYHYRSIANLIWVTVMWFPLLETNWLWASVVKKKYFHEFLFTQAWSSPCLNTAAAHPLLKIEQSIIFYETLDNGNYDNHIFYSLSKTCYLYNFSDHYLNIQQPHWYVWSAICKSTIWRECQFIRSTECGLLCTQKFVFGKGSSLYKIRLTCTSSLITTQQKAFGTRACITRLCIGTYAIVSITGIRDATFIDIYIKKKQIFNKFNKACTLCENNK